MKILLIIVLALLAVVQAMALPDVEVLPNNQMRVQDVREGRTVGAPVLVRIQGMVAGQTLVAAGIPAARCCKRSVRASESAAGN